MTHPEQEIQISGGKAQGIVGVGQAQVGSINFYETNVYPLNPLHQQSVFPNEKRYTSYPRRMFIQYLNPEIISLYGIPNRFSSLELNHHALRLTRYALLVSNEVVVMPASYIFEIPFIDKFLKEIDLLLIAGLLQFASSTPDFQEYARRKKIEYRDELNVFPDYAREDGLPITTRKLLWLPKVQRTSAGDISRRWRDELYMENGFWRSVLDNVIKEQGHLSNRVESKIESIPDRLENRAFILRFTKPLLPITLNSRDETLLGIMISQSYLESYLEELDATIFIDTPMGSLDCGLDQFGKNGGLRTLSFRSFHAFLQSINLHTYIEYLLKWDELVELKDFVVFRWLMDKVVENILNPTHPLTNAMIKSRYSPPELNIYHSRNNRLQEVKTALWQFVDAVEPVLESSHL